MEKDFSARIQAIFPDLTITSLEINLDGLVNDVAIVNGEWVFRFAKTERGAQILENEVKILHLLRPRLSLAIPTPVHQQKGVIVYRLLPGEWLTHARILQMEKKDQKQIAQQLGNFLYQMHNTPVQGVDLPTTLAPVHRSDWLDLHARIKARLYQLLLPHQRQWVEALFDSILTAPNAFDYSPCIIHGDLAPYHIFYDSAMNTLTGVIDFGVGGLGDPASDIASLITAYGFRIVQYAQSTYPDMKLHLPRARFYAQAIELQWVLLGLETGETFWFTAHLGGVRDIGV